MPNKQDPKRSARTAPSSAHIAEPDCKTNIRQPALPPTYSPFSRSHRFELNSLLEDSSIELSIAFCHTWAASREVDPAIVVDWVRRRSLGGSRQGGPLAAQGKDTNEAGFPVSSPSTTSVSISVKRERAASPNLSEPVKKKRKAGRGRVDSTLTHASSSHLITTSSETVRHTRAHDTSPHPSCPTCILAGDSSDSDHPPSGPQAAHTEDSDAMAALTPSVLDFVSSAIPSISRPVLKSALRLSRRTSVRPPRRVRFSEALYQEALAAYTQRNVSGRQIIDAYTQAPPSGLAELVSPTLPPRQKRKRAVYAGEEAVSSLPSQDGSGRLVPATSSGVHSSQATSAVASPTGSSVAAVSMLFSDGSSARYKAGSHAALQLQLSSQTPGSSESLLRLSLEPGMEAEPTHDNSAAASKRRRVLHPPAGLPFSTDAPMCPAQVEAAVHILGLRSVAPAPAPAPHTPSPRPSSASGSGSFFSPSFFSPSGASSSGEDEVEALLASSPPTSPVLIPRSSSPCAIVAPSPRKLSAPSFIDVPQKTDLSIHEPALESALDTPSTSPPGLVSFLHVDERSAGQRSPSPRSLPPPADIPPRTRTPPNPGPGPGSKPSTPQPSRPPRPASEDVVMSSMRNRECDDAGVIIIPRPPPGAPGSGSRPSTPTLGRHLRPSAASEKMRDVRGDEAEEVCIDVGCRMYACKEDDAGASGAAHAYSSRSLEPHTAPPMSFAPTRSAAPVPPSTGRMAVATRVSTSRPIQAVAAGPDTAEHLNTCAPPDFIGWLVGSVNVGDRTQTHSEGEKRPANAQLPIPPRARTPPCPPDRGSRPSTPQPVRPPRPSADAVLPAANAAAAPKKGTKEKTKEKRKTPAKAIKTGRAAGGAKRATAAVQIKIEVESAEPGRADEVPTLRLEDDDEPLATVVSRKKAISVVKAEPVDAVISVAKQARKPGKKTGASGPAKGKGKSKVAAAVAVTAVKAEEGAPAAVGETHVRAPAKKKRVTKPEAPKTKGTTQGATQEETSVKEEASTTIAIIANPCKPSSTAKRPRKKRVTKDAGAAAVDRDGGDGNVAVKTGKKVKKITKALEEDTGSAADKAETIASTTPAAAPGASPSRMRFHISFSLSRSSSLQRKESFKGIRHPPRTFTYLPEHLQDLGTLVWDAEGFNCMELSALPWLAATAEHACAPGELIIGNLGDSMNEETFEPTFPDHVFMDEEDVYMQLYANGPLPASFVDALGRAVSVRREGEKGDECIAAGSAVDDEEVVGDGVR
ncbi:hypothetical protein BV20DRAFT_1057722 [Pilatotrama ljubarskyi]|nr:hypothetical protein BV20DRAFT_1057722 [Pilatotrama ljubarskyi]